MAKLKFVPTCEIWNETINEFMETETGIALRKRVTDDRYDHVVYPDKEDLFKAFKLCPYNKLKVVIIGQDPYHDGSADGLAFSSKKQRTPPSLKNIFAEVLRSEYHIGVLEEIVFKSNSLESWAEQGVLLINTALTVIEKKPKSHNEIGWLELIKKVISKANENTKPTVFMLWGTEAKLLGNLINNPIHLKLESNHPQAQNYNPAIKFVGNNHFKLCNQFFVQQSPQILGINWRTL